MAIDLFAGAGGLSLGLEQAGFDVVAAVEIDPIHACVHQYNFPQCHVLAQPIEKVSGKDIRTLVGLTSEQSIELVAGGAPCQGFSLIGQRLLDDPRNHLVKEYLRLIKELEPTYFLFENVKGLTAGKHRQFLEELIRSLETLGYRVVQPWQVLNAKFFGVPQSRERLFLMGAKEGEALPHYPVPTTSQPITCGEALGDLPDAELFRELIDSDEVDFIYPQPLGNYGAMLRCLSREAWQWGYQRQWDREKLTNSIRTNHSDRARQRFLETAPGSIEKVSRFLKLSRHGIANTLRAGTDAARGAFTSPRPIHYQFPRCITVREMARLHGFPDWFRLHRTKWHGARQIGNSVPPPLAYAIASAIMAASRYTPQRPNQVLTLGDPQLLKTTMSTASHYWGIEPPIQKRNRRNRDLPAHRSA
ncbi:site-specific DNA-methyltransferase [[Synechococcus] sp. NIES-970]|uniref:DNA cytosine methyltransferase n=1 Tax=Picosynechococcus sp. NKBG15041c TaxID=1407650 RepID=UPI0003F8D429|nr:DNA cytosine methyltransferase [Picosynechococcus sp. NKBG15041c]BAW95172.1 site-specific DNA-methyltransferase [[Synechococcus] sp. NIES-970]